MSARLALLLVLALAGCADEPGTAGTSDRSEPRNVVLVVVDTLRADATGIGGYDLPTTPNLDAFSAERGVVFRRAWSTAPWTKPSMASMFTGLRPRAHGVLLHPDALHEGHRTLAEVFAEAGYATHGVQSNPLLHGAEGFGQGFARYEDGETMARHATSTGDAVNAAALAWLDARDASRPFFLYVHHYEPHHDYLRYDAEFRREGEGLELAPEREAQLAEATMDALMGAIDRLDAADVAYVRARYDSEVRYQDELLGELFDGLDARGLLDASVVVVTADHGEEFMEHGSLSHVDDKLYEELVRVPLVVAEPGRAPGVVERPVSLQHLGATLLGLVGLEDAAFGAGSWFLAGGASERGAVPPVVFLHGKRSQARGDALEVREVEGVVASGAKLLREVGTGNVEVYDLGADPGERQPRATGDVDVGALEAALDRGAAGTVPPNFPPESDAVLRRREEYRSVVYEEMRKLGYFGDAEESTDAGRDGSGSAAPRDEEPR